MEAQSQIITTLTYPAVVGTVHSTTSLGAARKIHTVSCDWLELRVDNFFPDVEELRRAAPKMRPPRIVTVRHASEGGGAAGMPVRQRRALYRDFLEVAGLVDVELRQAGPMREVIREAKEAEVGVILSYHNFRGMPSLESLCELARRAEAAGGDIFKVAAMAEGPRELATLIEFLANERGRMPLAVMGMGRYGKISRLALAQAGSCLNYGYLGEANASGQWPVELLKARIAEVLEGSGGAAGAGWPV